MPTPRRDCAHDAGFETAFAFFDTHRPRRPSGPATLRLAFIFRRMSPG
jgi:hypothetical protein